MRLKEQKTASATVFFLLVLTLILSFTFSLLEAARVHCLNRQTAVNAELCMQSMFGNYNAALWEDYHVLLMDGAWQKEEFSIHKWESKAMEDVCTGGEENINLFLYTPKSVQALEYELATDQEGAVFRRQVSKKMQKEAVIDVVQELMGLEEDSGSLEGQKQQSSDAWSQAWDAITEAEEIAEVQKEEKEEKTQTKSGKIEGTGKAEQEISQQHKNQNSAEPGQDNSIENPMEYVKALKGSPILSLMMEDPASLSVKSVEGPFLKDRVRERGNWKQTTNAGTSERLFFQYFINQYFSNEAQESPNGPQTRALSYEMEYVIGGKSSDSENLERVVYELLALREAANFVTLMQDAEKKEMAFGAAVAAVGFTGVFPLIKAVQIGILLAWAFIESILDVRALLTGKKIPLVKAPSEWNSDISNCRKVVEEKKESDETDRGLTYGAYLQMLLFFISDETITYRTLDLIEKNLKLTSGNENVCMDHMIASVRAQVRYEAKPLFWNLIFVKHRNWNQFSFEREVTLSY